MLDLNLIRSNPEYVKEALKKREYDVDFSELLEWDARRRALLVENESLKAERNRMSKEIHALKKQGKDASELLAKLKEMADQVKAMDEEQSALEDLSLIHICLPARRGQALEERALHRLSLLRAVRADDGGDGGAFQVRLRL